MFTWKKSRKEPSNVGTGMALIKLHLWVILHVTLMIGNWGIQWLGIIGSFTNTEIQDHMKW